MPLYEYQCQSCGNTFELIQKFSDPPAEHCPRCGGPVKKLLSSPAIQFKGSGWYVTDYARKGGTGGAKADAGAASGSSSDAPKTESKNESKSSDSGGSGPKSE